MELYEARRFFAERGMAVDPCVREDCPMRLDGHGDHWVVYDSKERDLFIHVRTDEGDRKFLVGHIEGRNIPER